jgi:hypothetical protein
MNEKQKQKQQTETSIVAAKKSHENIVKCSTEILANNTKISIRFQVATFQY